MEIASLDEKLRGSVETLQGLIGDRRPQVAIILGSGLGLLGDHVSNSISIPFQDIPFMKTSTAPGHKGRFVVGDLGGREVIILQGRLHGYEGYTSQEVAYPVWLLARLGIEVLITTNAAGAINESFSVGDLCFMADHINFTGRNPVAGAEPAVLAPRFFSMADAYDPRLRAHGLACAARLGLPAHEGVYLGLKGPSFETAAEIRAFRLWGADTVAMSVCEEVIAARQMGLKVLGISLCTNMACGVDGADPTDAEVFEVAMAREKDFLTLMEAIIATLPDID